MIKNKLYPLLLIVSIKISFAQSPGAVSANLQLWLNANVGVVGGAAVTTWSDQSTVGNHLTQGTAANRPNATTNLINYNSSVTFDGSDFLSRTAATFTQGLSARECFIVTSSITTTAPVHSTAFFMGTNPANDYQNMGYGISSTSSTDLIFSGNVTGPSAFYRVNHGKLVTMPSLHNYNATTNIPTNQYTLTSNNAIGTGTFQFGSAFTPTVTGALMMIGARYSTISLLTSFVRGNISEIVFYGRRLSTTERLSVSSYLAVKYGITLDNSTGGDNGNYTTTAGAVIWTASLSPTYHNNVIGIGRDNASSVLAQKQSQTVDDTVRIYKGSLNTTNAGNTSTFASNVSYVMIGNKQGKVCGAFATNAEIPSSCGLVKRIEREWKVTKTNYAETFNMDIKLNGCAGTSSINVADLRLLVDDDGDFSNGGTNCYYNGDGTGIVISYASPVVTFSNITNTHIPNNATRYITLGSNNLATPLPVELVNFSSDCDVTNNSTILKWTTLSETNNDYFDVEKSADAVTWNPLTHIDGAGNSNAVKNYLYKDADRSIQSEDGMSYYRLKQIDFDGTQTVFGSVIYTDQSCQVFFPNPASDKIYIKDFTHFKSYDIVNQLGQIVKSGEVSSNTITLSNIADGMYHIKLTGLDEKVISKKLQINKK